MSKRSPVFLAGSLFFGLCCSLAIGAIIGFKLNDRLDTQTSLLTPFVELTRGSDQPLRHWSIPSLQKSVWAPSKITITKELSKTSTHSSYLFTIMTLEKNMTGQLNLPSSFIRQPSNNSPVIVMLRGYVAPEDYQTGVGTKAAAAEFAKAGFITIAPDFLGYGQSDPEPADTWEARFIKPAIVTELITTIRKSGIPHPTAAQPFVSTQLGLWGHSNGGQIALTTLEILQEPLPTTLWAPVTVPFPYSILYFTDESDDESKQLRKSLAEFEAEYDVFEFSLTRYLPSLRGPLQLHHGTADDAALKIWSDEFVSKIDAENVRRTNQTGEDVTLDSLVTTTTTSASSSTTIASASNQTTTAAASPIQRPIPSPAANLANSNPNTQSATTDATSTLSPIELSYFSYVGADHNLRPGWETVIARDIDFFRKWLIK